MYKLKDNVILQDIYFEEYNNKVFTIIDIYITENHGYLYKVSRDGFDSVWVTEDNFI